MTTDTRKHVSSTARLTGSPTHLLAPYRELERMRTELTYCRYLLLGLGETLADEGRLKDAQACGTANCKLKATLDTLKAWEAAATLGAAQPPMEGRDG